MSLNRRKAFFILMALWFLMIASYTVYKEIGLNYGKSVMLKVLPVDPRDLFRGDYVILTYEISSPEPSQRIIDPYGSYMEDELLSDGETVYVMLEKDGDFYKGGDIYKARPQSGLYIKGNVRSDSEIFGFRSANFNIIYGIESYFVPEGEGLIIEKQADRNAVSVEVMINSFGSASIKNLYINGKKADFKNKNEKNY